MLVAGIALLVLALGAALLVIFGGGFGTEDSDVDGDGEVDRDVDQAEYGPSHTPSRR